MQKPRELTTDEVRENLLRQVWRLVDYWDKNAPRRDVHGKLSGLAFSILAMLDGADIDIPRFIVAPCPHEADQSYHEQREENWHPYNDPGSVKCDVAGSLHELFHKFNPRNRD